MSAAVARFTIISAGLFVVGYGLSALLFSLRNKQLRGSSLQKKIHTWIPIFVLVVLMAWGPRVVAAIILLVLAAAVMADYTARRPSLTGTRWAPLHLLVVLSGLGALYMLTQGNAIPLFAVWFMSVASDVTAYFFGNFFGNHHLPALFNRHKSWEGVAGQVLGAGIGYVLFVWVDAVPIWVWPAVGLGSAAGDMANSYVKRAGGFKDWSGAIPGHGGFIDRLSSLSYAACFVALLSYVLVL